MKVDTHKGTNSFEQFARRDNHNLKSTSRRDQIPATRFWVVYTNQRPSQKLVTRTTRRRDLSAYDPGL